MWRDVFLESQSDYAVFEQNLCCRMVTRANAVLMTSFPKTLCHALGGPVGPTLKLTTSRCFSYIPATTLVLQERGCRPAIQI